MPRAFLLQKKKKKSEEENPIMSGEESDIQVTDGEEEEDEEELDDEEEEIEVEGETEDEEMEDISSPLPSPSSAPLHPSPRTPGSSPAKPDPGKLQTSPISFRSSENSAFSRIERLISEPSSREKEKARASTISPPGFLPYTDPKDPIGHGETPPMLGNPFREMPGMELHYQQRQHIAAMMRFGIPPPPIPRELLPYSDPRLPITHYFLNLARLASENPGAHPLPFPLQPPPAHSHPHIPRHHPGLHHPLNPHPHPHPHRNNLYGLPTPKSTPKESSEERKSDGEETVSPVPISTASPTVLSVPVGLLQPYPSVESSPGAGPPHHPHPLRLLPAHAHPGVSDAASGMVPTAWLGGLGGLGGGRPRDPSKPPATKKYKCDVCGKSFSRSNTLVTHKRIHTGEKPFACETCGRAFRQPGNLTRHRLTHTTVKPYVCPRCGKAFNRASNLHTHMRTHTNYKPYVCTYCGKGFNQKIDMKIHTYTHTGMCARLPERPHASRGLPGGVASTS